ncbi:MAG: T9SS type A sorting domain-containing protein, partial [Legionellales bacterium]
FYGPTGSPSADTFGVCCNRSAPVETLRFDGTWNVCLVASNFFGSSARVCKLVGAAGVGINEVQFSEHINLFPNPSNDKVFISIEGMTSPDFTVTAYNLLGEPVTTPAVYKAGTTNVELNMSSVASGMYMIKIQSSLGTAVKQVVIANK